MAIGICIEGMNTCPTESELIARMMNASCRSPSGSCDWEDFCDGKLSNCVDSVKVQGTICRPKKGPCDIADSCDGTTKTCSPDLVFGSGHVCRPEFGTCDLAEVCTFNETHSATGKDNEYFYLDDVYQCPTNVFKGKDVVCRNLNASLECDLEEYCTGNGSECPFDSFKAQGSECGIGDSCFWFDQNSTHVKVCGSDGKCFGENHCNCTSNNDCNDGFPCTIDQCVNSTCNYSIVSLSDGKICRESVGGCDKEERCDGGEECPIDSFLNGTVCREINENDLCDSEERCDGKSSICPRK